MRLQKLGFTIPNIISGVIAFCIVLSIDMSNYKSVDGENNTTTTAATTTVASRPTIFPTSISTTTTAPDAIGYWKYSECDSPLENFFDYFLILLIAGIAILVLSCFRLPNLWSNNSMAYDFERNIFLIPSYRPVHTGFHALFNRRLMSKNEDLLNSNSILPDITNFAANRKTALWTTGQKVPMLFVCATLWHETFEEMSKLVGSLVRLLRHLAAKRESNASDLFNVEMHIFFDNVFDNVKDDGKFLNDYTQSFMKALAKGLRLYDLDTVLKKGTIITTPYGGRVVFNILGYDLIIHLKDAEKCKAGKRWSQVMYLYYLIGWKVDSCQYQTNGLPVQREKTFILTLDGDVDFEPDAVEMCLNRLLRNDSVAACCGQIIPTGSSWLVWYQRFEYAVGHWFQKTAEHVLGSVL